MFKEVLKCCKTTVQKFGFNTILIERNSDIYSPVMHSINQKEKHLYFKKSPLHVRGKRLKTQI